MDGELGDGAQDTAVEPGDAEPLQDAAPGADSAAETDAAAQADAAADTDAAALADGAVDGAGDSAIAGDAPLKDQADSAADAGSGKDGSAVDSAADAVPEIQVDGGPKPDAAVEPPALLAPCDSSKDCIGPLKTCDLTVHGCVACLAATDCPIAQHCQANSCAAGLACSTDLACKATGQVCDKVSGACVDCLADTDCGSAGVCVKHVCKSAPPCKSSKECPAVCNTAKGVCQECLSAADCQFGQACSGGVCAAKVCEQDGCVGGKLFACQLGATYLPGSSCSDVSPCTQDTCAAGACKFTATAGACEDNNPCTADSCEVNGCVHTATGGPCSDGDACTEGDACAAGNCASGKAKDCSDANPCTTDSCKAGACANVANSATCDDKNACTSADKCAAGKCAGATSISCDDKDPCTADSCNPQSGTCSHVETCGGKTFAVPYSIDFPCGAVLEGWTMEAKSPNSNSVWAVDATPIVPGAKSPGCSLNFNDGKAISCKSFSYLTVTSPRLDATAVPADQPLVLRFWLAGDWAPQFETGLALWTSTDGVKYDIETTYDPQGAGWVQVATALPKLHGKKFYLQFSFFMSDCAALKGSGPFIDDLEVLWLPCKTSTCGDGNPCTSDGCDLLTAKCSNPENPQGVCSDGDPCTAGDFCFQKKCIGGIGSLCDDKNPCTTDNCSAGNCQNTAKDCNDANSCTADSCDAATGQCKFANAAGSCTDSDACTVGDACAAGACKAGTAKSCDDANPCTSNACFSADGTCQFAPVTAPCSDGDACTAGDSCVLGTCSPGATKDCDDKDACTADYCDSATGTCKHPQSPLCSASALPLPYSSSFDCTGPSTAGWTATGIAGGPGWAFDATPSWSGFDGYHSASCSANFNDGWDINCPASGKFTTVSGELTSPNLDASAVSSGQQVWVRAWMMGDFNAGATLHLETTTDGFTWTIVRTYSPDALSETVWRQFVDPLPGMAGKKFKLRWRFDSNGCLGNTNQPGAFIDDVKVYAAAPCSQEDPYSISGFDPPYYPTFMMGYGTYTLDPPLYAGGAMGGSKSASWHVDGYSSKKVNVKVMFAGAATSMVCVSHKCDGIGAPCKIACPAGTIANGTATGCCMSKVDTGTIEFYPTGTAYGSGKTTVTVTPQSGGCQKIDVKAVLN